MAKFPTPPFSLAVGMGCAALALAPVMAQAQTAAAGGEPTPVRTKATSGGDKADKKSRRNRAQAEASPTPLPFPLGLGMPASNLKIPETDPTGRLLSQLLAAKATRVDNEHVEMKEMTIDLNHPDGREDYHVVMPTSVFNLQTRIVSSQEPVVVRTQDFELTGEGMEFNTVERTGKLMGKVRMIIRNLKGLAGQAEPSPKPE